MKTYRKARLINPSREEPHIARLIYREDRGIMVRKRTRVFQQKLGLFQSARKFKRVVYS